LKDFVVALARAIKVKKKPKILTDHAYGKKSLKRMQIFHIITEINEGKTQLISGIPTSQKTITLRTLSPLPPTPLKITTGKLS
jgi:hypothetical protein